MMSILPHNENQTFITYNLEEDLVAIWSWDDGSELYSAMGSRKYYAGSSKWTELDNLDGDEANGDEADLKLWEFDNCLVQDSSDPQEEQKVEDDEKEKEGDEEDEEPKMSTNECDEGASKSATKEEPFQRSVDGNQPQEHHQTTSEGTVEEDRPDTAPKPKIWRLRRSLASSSSSSLVSADRKATPTIGSNDGKEYNNALDDDVEEGEKKGLQTPEKPHDDIHAAKDQSDSVLDSKPTDPIAFVRTPPTPRKQTKAPLNIPAIPEDALSPEVTRETLDNIMSPRSKSAKIKNKSRKSKIDNAVPLEEPDDDDESGASTTKKKKPEPSRSQSLPQETGASTTKKKKPDPSRSQSLPQQKDEDSVVSKSKKKKKKEKPTSSGSKPKKSKIGKGASSRNVSGEEQRQSGEDGDEISQLNNALLSPRNTKKRNKRRSTWWDISGLPSYDDDDVPLKLPTLPKRPVRKQGS